MGKNKKTYSRRKTAALKAYKKSPLRYWWWQKDKLNTAISGPEGRLNTLKGDFGDLPTNNLFSKVKNPYAGIQNPYADIQTDFENVYEDMIGVDTTGVDAANKEFQQNLATTLDQMRQMGVVNIQGLANATQQQSDKTRAELGSQIRQSQMLRAQGAEKVQTQEQGAEMKVAEGAHAVEMTRAQGAHTAEMARIQGAVDARNLEYQKTQGLMALEASQLESARANKVANRNWFQKVFG